MTPSRHDRLTVVVSVALSALLALSAWAILPPEPAGAAPATAASASPETELLTLTNGARSANGLAALSADPKAADIARYWSNVMAGDGSLRHNPDLAAQVNNLVTSSWQRIGENVGVGSSATGLHDAFMKSPGHKANVLGDYNRVGIGAARDASGRLWVTLVFIKGPALAPYSAPAQLPFGNLDLATTAPGVVELGGWAVDADWPASPVNVHLYVNGVWAAAVSAGQPRADIAGALPWAGPNHGWTGRLALSRGTHTICAYGIDPTGRNPQVGCRVVSIGGAGFGSVDTVVPVPGGFAVQGWAIDPDTTQAVAVHLYVNGRWAGQTTASGQRTDVASALPAYGPSHGYGTPVGAGHGWIQVCAYGIDAAGGDTNPRLGCTSHFRDARPFGNLDVARQDKGGIEISGWAIDPDTATPTSVHVYVDGKWAGALSADVARTDVELAVPGYGPAHGFSAVLPASGDTQTVCVHAIDIGTAVGNPLLRCQKVTAG